MNRTQPLIWVFALLLVIGGISPNRVTAEAPRQICTFEDLVRTFYAGSERRLTTYIAPFIDDKISLEVVDTSGNIARVEFYFGETRIGNVPLDGTPLNYSVSPTAPFDTDFTLKVVGNRKGFGWADVRMVYTGICLYGNPGPLEAPNLVLLQGNSALLDEPKGKSVKQWLLDCQTVFIVEISPDGSYGRVGGFGNAAWIDMRDTYDVEEDYGQPSGQAILPQCVGK